MVVNYASNVYHRTAIETADPLQLIILCYDAAINDLQIAKEHHEKKWMTPTGKSGMPRT